MPVLPPTRNPNEYGSDPEDDNDIDVRTERQSTPDTAAEPTQLPTPSTNYFSSLVDGLPLHAQNGAVNLMMEAFAYMSDKDNVGSDHTGIIEPSSYKEAIKSKQASLWQKAMELEINDHIKRGTWCLEKLPPGRKAIGGRWVYKVKIGADNRISRYKARWVARGFAQVHGVDYTHTFAPTARPATVRLFFAIATAWGWKCNQIDIKLAYLSGIFLDGEVIYVFQPDGFDDGSGRVCRLLLPIYGLKQSARTWYVSWCKAIATLGFKPSAADECLFVRSDGSMIVLHVDDALILGPDSAAIVAALAKIFEVSDAGPVAYYLGMKVDCGDHRIKLSQRAYIERLLETFDAASPKGSSTPMDEGVKLHALLKEEEANDKEFIRRYQAAIGAIMYLMLQTRPDIAFATSKLMRFASNPSKGHMAQAIRLIRYLRQTIDYGIVFEANPGHDKMQRLGTLEGFVDADYAGCLDTRRSTTGYVFMICNGPVSWISKLQTTVSLSTCEAEYTAITQASKEAVWFTYILKDLCFAGIKPIIIHTDSQSALKLSENSQFHSRTKHIDIAKHWIREVIANGAIALKFVDTDNQIADVLTKALGRIKYVANVDRLGVKR